MAGRDGASGSKRFSGSGIVLKYGSGSPDFEVAGFGVWY